MNETEFRNFARKEGFREPEVRSQPPGRFFESHAHEDDLIVLVTAGAVTVDYGETQYTFKPGDMCEVKHGIPHTDAMGPDGASYVLAWRSPPVTNSQE
ncbi:MAG: cupin domain-containing protein [Alphaproteobacteria bacterium]